jgi:hypothetical protein
VQPQGLFVDGQATSLCGWKRVLGATGSESLAPLDSRIQQLIFSVKGVLLGRDWAG